MGRLFWKFFFFFWLAQIVTSAGVGVAIWLARPEHAPAPVAAGEPPPPQGQPFGAEPPPHPGEHRPRNRFPLPPALPLAAGGLVSLLFAALLAWYFARPIRSLRQAFEAVAGGRLETRVGASMGRRKDELADLGSDFDHMADRLQGLLDSQRRLLHDVSHELRSPLARLQAAADLMRQQPERAADFIERIQRDTGRIDTLVGELLALARLDAGITGSLAEELDLHGMLELIADDAGFEAKAKGCAVELDLPGPIFAKGSYDLIYRALENVVRNAVRHSPADGRIVIAARPEEKEGRVCISVADQGAGVPEADLEAIFEPFFRSGSADAFSGYGLGLAITKRIVDAHGGRIFAANRPEGGLAVTLLLPARA